MPWTLWLPRTAYEPIYGPAMRRNRISSSWRRAVLHQCIRPLTGSYAPHDHGHERAGDLMSGQASRQPFGPPVSFYRRPRQLARRASPQPRLNGLEDAVRQYSGMPHRLAFRAICSVNPLLSERDRFSNLLVPFGSLARKTLQGVRNGRECPRPIDPLWRGVLMLCGRRATILHTTAIAFFS